MLFRESLPPLTLRLLVQTIGDGVVLLEPGDRLQGLLDAVIGRLSHPREERFLFDPRVAGPERRD